MIYIKLSRKELTTDRIERGDDPACEDGLALFDAVLAAQNETRRKPKTYVRIAWTPLAYVWLARDAREFSTWLFEHGYIAKVTLRDADLSYANLRGADLSGADLRDADLSGANLSYADLRGADLRYANLRYANLRYANLSDANLRDANLRDADLSGADLRGADLRGADLSDADLRGANLRDADLSGADLRGAFRSPMDAMIEGWKVADGLLVKVV